MKSNNNNHSDDNDTDGGGNHILQLKTMYLIRLTLRSVYQKKIMDLIYLPKLLYLILDGFKSMKKTSRKERGILFRSIGAYALEDSPEGDNTAIVGFMLNCDYPKYSELKDNFVNHCFDVIIKPALVKLPYKTPHIDTINRIHIIMYAAQSKNTILFNDEVRFEANVQFEGDKSYLPDDIISEEFFVKVLGLYPTQKNDINAAHVLFYKLTLSGMLLAIYFMISRGVHLNSATQSNF